jgi:hypothetical protein
MGNRIFVAAVVLLWAGTMSWLLVARILPPFFQGEPPSRGPATESVPNYWQIELHGQAVGSAASQSVPGAFGTTEHHSRLKLNGIELRKLFPFQLGSLIHGLNTIQLDMRSRVTLDSLGSLSSFDTKIQLTEVPLVIDVRGRVEGAELNVTLQSGELKHSLMFPVPKGGLIATDLFPESKLMDLKLGRRWQQEVFSPFKESMEIVQAEVVSDGVFEHQGMRHNAKRIEYRTLSSVGVATDNTLRSVVWVGDNGTVLRQDLNLVSITLRFERRDEPRAVARAEKMLDLEAFATTPPKPER